MERLESVNLQRIMYLIVVEKKRCRTSVKIILQPLCFQKSPDIKLAGFPELSGMSKPLYAQNCHLQTFKIQSSSLGGQKTLGKETLGSFFLDALTLMPFYS